MDIKDFEPLFGSWYVESLIGSGSFGKVYKIKREEFGAVYHSALKWISIPRDDSEMKQLRYDGLDNESISEYYKDVVTDLVNEMQLMSRLRGRSSIVSYEDHSVVSKSNNMGYDIFIRMELLISLNDYMQTHELSRADVIRLGINLCEALELCQKYNIIHRDIKPDNIFVAETGEFKLGDFGIARQLEKTTASLSIKGTYYYMAPEVYKGERYNSSVDTYSLGIVLYRLLNDGRLPFLPLNPAPVRQKDRDQSLVRRMSGEQMVPPQNTEGRLGDIVLKACAYDPKDRYSSPRQMREELQAIQIPIDDVRFVYKDGDNLGILEMSNNRVSDPDKTEIAKVIESSKPAIQETSDNRPSALADDGLKPAEYKNEQNTSLDKTSSSFGNTMADKQIVSETATEKSEDIFNKNASLMQVRKKLITTGAIVVAISIMSLIINFFVGLTDILGMVTIVTCYISTIILFISDRCHVGSKLYGGLILISLVSLSILVPLGRINIAVLPLLILILISILIYAAILIWLYYRDGHTNVSNNIIAKNQKSQTVVKQSQGTNKNHAMEENESKKKGSKILLLVGVIATIASVLYSIGYFTYYYQAITIISCVIGIILLFCADRKARLLPLPIGVIVFLSPVFMIGGLNNTSTAVSWILWITPSTLACIYTGLIVSKLFRRYLVPKARNRNTESFYVNPKRIWIVTPLLIIGVILLLCPFTTSMYFGNLIFFEVMMIVEISCFFIADRIGRILPKTLGWLNLSVLILQGASFLYMLSSQVFSYEALIFFAIFLETIGKIYAGILIGHRLVE